MSNLFKQFTNSFLVLAIFAMYLPTNADAKRRSSSWGSSKSKSSSRSSRSSGFFSKKKKTRSSSNSWGYNSKKKTTTSSYRKKTSSSYNGSTQKAKDSRARQAELRKKREALKAKRSSVNKTSVKPKTTNGFGSTVKRGQTPAKTGKTVRGNKFDQKRNKTITKKRNKTAYASYKKDKLKFKGDRRSGSSGKSTRNKTAKVSPKQRTVYKTRYINRSRSNSYYGRNSYYDRRSSYYDGYGFHTRPYMYNYSSHFGMWDGIFLWALLSNNHGSQHIYHHQSDPGVQQWMATAREEAKENAELRAQLNKMDADIAKMKTQGVKVDEAYLPEDVDPDIAFDPDFVEENSDMFYDDDLTQLDELDKMLHPSNFN